MKPLLIPILLIIGLQSCENDPRTENEFVYNEAMGKCENAEGKTGFNIFSLDRIRKTKNAECIDLSGHELVYLIDTSKIENFNELGNNTLEGYNFKGSKFDGAEIFFNNIEDADFSGADLRNLGYGYAVITGKIDQFTLLPTSGSCGTEGDSMICHQ